MSVVFMLVVMSLVLCGPYNISLTESPLGSLMGWFSGDEFLQFLFGKTFISSSILNDRLLDKGFLAAYFFCSSH